MSKAGTALVDQVHQLPLDLLHPSTTNPRKSFDVVTLNELAESIRQNGIHQPLIVRPFGESYELVTGHRRLKAAEIAGLKKVPAIVRELSDSDAREVQIVENLQREDIHPLDEADSYAELLKDEGTVQRVAAKVAKPIEYVTRRLKLQSLSDFSRTAFAEKLVPLDHALLLAKLGQQEQEKALRYTLDRAAGVKTKTEEILREAIAEAKEERESGELTWEPASVSSLKSFIEEELKLELKRAPWDLADADLVPTAGACTTCPSNTAANQALFGDLAIEHATCTDSACFNAKRQAFVQLKVEAVNDAGKAAVKLSYKHSSAKPKFMKDGSGPDLATTFKAGQWVEAKKDSCDNVITGVMVDYEEGWNAGNGKPGVKKQVCVAAGCKAHKKDYEKSKGQRSGSSSYDPAKEEAKREEKRAAAKKETDVRMKLATAAVSQITKLTPTVLRLAITKLVPDWGDDVIKELAGADYKSRLKTIKTDSAEFAKIVAALLIHNLVEVDEWDRPEESQKRFNALLSALGVDGAKLRKVYEKPADTKPQPTKTAKKKSSKKR